MQLRKYDTSLQTILSQPWRKKEKALSDTFPAEELLIKVIDDLADFLPYLVLVDGSNSQWKEKISMIKTSISHPLRIDEVKVPNGSGIIGMTLWSYINSLLCYSSKEDIDA